MTHPVRTAVDLAADIRENIESLNSTSTASEAARALKRERELWIEVESLNLAPEVRRILKAGAK